jgi:hypothetical protein
MAAASFSQQFISIRINCHPHMRDRRLRRAHTRPEARPSAIIAADRLPAPTQAGIMAEAELTISGKNYSSWSLRGRMLCRRAGIDFRQRVVPADDPSIRAELLLLSPSFLVPCLTYDGTKVWDTLAIGGFLNELRPAAGLYPSGQAARAHCRSIAGEMHSGFANLRAALPMNLKAHYPGFRIWSGSRPISTG